MEQDNKKIITLSFVIMGFLSFLVARVIFQALAVSFGFVGKYWSMTSVQHGLPVAVGFLVFLLLQFNRKVMGWGDEVVTETRKVVWPSKKDTTAMTIVTCIMLIIAGVVLGVFDLISSQVVKVLLNL